MEPGKKIAPELASLYHWALKEEPDEIEIVITLPPAFNIKTLEAQLTDDNQAICISIPGEVPILRGKLMAPVTAMTQTIEQNQVTYALTKETPGTWGIVIGDVDSEREMDPLSTMILMEVMAKTGQGDNEILAALLLKCAETGFAPALIKLYAALGDDPENLDVKMQCIQTAAIVYGNPIAKMYLATELAKNPETRDQAMELYQSAMIAGIPTGGSMVGQMLSPLSDVEFDMKDAEKAVAVFEAVMSVDPSETLMLVEYSKLLFNGVGVKKDVERAMKMHGQAKGVIGEIPDLCVMRVVNGKVQTGKDSSFSLFNMFGIAAVGCAVAGGAYTLVRLLRRRM